LIENKFAELKETITLRRDETKGFEAALQVVKENKGKKLMDDMRKVIADMDDEEYSLLKQRSEEAQAAARLYLLCHRWRHRIFIRPIVSRGPGHYSQHCQPAGKDHRHGRANRQGDLRANGCTTTRAMRSDNWLMSSTKWWKA